MRYISGSDFYERVDEEGKVVYIISQKVGDRECGCGYG